MSYSKIITFSLTIFSLLCLFSAQTCSTVSNPSKLDCGYSGINQQLCEAKGCCWLPVNPNPDNYPWCFYLKDPCTSINLNASTPGFSSSDIATMTSNFYANLNIGGKGGVVASPDTNVGSGGSYYYHWMRDGSLSMRAYMEVNDYNFTEIQTDMDSYVNWVLNAQSAQDPNSIDVRVEPKFMLPDGGVFSGGWCRPQDDGPALRSTTLMKYAQLLESSGQTEFISENLWTGSSSSKNGGAIKYDLDWIATSFVGFTTCDLWEEIRNTEIFWNYMVARRALLMGSAFATKMGDSASASTYKTAAQNIENSIDSTFWTGAYYMEANNRQKDAAVIIAFNRGYNDDGFLAPIDPKIASTVATYNELFCATYPINQADTNNSIPGILYGRYEGDGYQGGNPWVLTSAGLAQLFYRGANYVLSQGSVSSEVISAWQAVFPDLSASATYEEFAQTLANAGNSVMQRIYYHVSADNFNLYEQIDKNTGKQLSAYSLTWSYANVLVALKEYQQFQQSKLIKKIFTQYK